MNIEDTGYVMKRGWIQSPSTIQYSSNNQYDIRIGEDFNIWSKQANLEVST